MFIRATNVVILVLIYVASAFGLTKAYQPQEVPVVSISLPEVKGGQVSVNVETSLNIDSARLYFLKPTLSTTGSSPDWKTQLLTVEGSRIHGDSPPRNATHWYILVTADGVIYSSKFMEVERDSSPPTEIVVAKNTAGVQ